MESMSGEVEPEKPCINNNKDMTSTQVRSHSMSPSANCNVAKRERSTRKRSQSATDNKQVRDLESSSSDSSDDEVSDSDDLVKNLVARNDASKKGHVEKRKDWDKRKLKNKKMSGNPAFLPIKTVKMLLEKQDPENMLYIQGYIRIDPRFPKHAYISVSGDEMDVLIINKQNRNRALEGDLVAALINPEEEWQPSSNGQKQKTARVVCIMEKLHSRNAVGHLKFYNKTYILYPTDRRIPKVFVRKSDPIIKKFIRQWDLDKDTHFVVHIDKWTMPDKGPYGHIVKVLGKNGDIKRESPDIFFERNPGISSDKKKLIDKLPNDDSTSTQLDIKNKKDRGSDFTIDPLKTVDSDDVISSKLLNKKNNRAYNKKTNRRSVSASSPTKRNVVEKKGSSKKNSKRFSSKKVSDLELSSSESSDAEENDSDDLIELVAAASLISKNAVTNDSDKDDHGCESKDGKKHQGKKKKGKKIRDYPVYLPRNVAEMLLEKQDPENMQYIQGYIRINPRCTAHAYIPYPGVEQDLLIIGVRTRNTALEGDLVVALVNPEEEWHTLPNGQKQKTGQVVCIMEKLHSRKAVGHLRFHGKICIFYPRDQRIPLIKLKRSDPILMQLEKQRDMIEDTLLLAQIDWMRMHVKADGYILKVLGKVGDIQMESEAILLEQNIDISPYDEALLNDLPSNDYILTELDRKDREDWRQQCVFTIDPSTAVDLDDAVSCKLLDNGNYEIGVHIADVTHFLEFLSPLDIEVAKRATTVYMTDNVYHMLPKCLCEICSLLPGQEKLAFSVIWEMTAEAKVVSHRFAKTVIKSCSQLTYEHAQMFIENPERDWPDDFLHVHGDFTLRELSTIVNHLYKLSVHLRTKRFAEGALSIGQAKLQVLLDRETGLPKSYILERQKDSNRLIEEFMLLANMTVASHLYSVEPETALLRSHTEPSMRVLRYAKEILEPFGVHIKTQSAADLEDSLKQYQLKMGSEAEEFHGITEYRMMVINTLCVKAMARATYKCSSTVKTKEELRHYALNVPLYTHFTSPIRRYVDCVVHRLLHSSINNIPLPKEWSRKMCIQIASNSNVRKYNAKLAQEESSKLYFAYLVRLSGPFVTLAVVAEVKERSMDVILCQVGIKLQVFYTDIKDNATVQYGGYSPVNSVTINWNKPAVTEVFSMFTLATVRLETDPEQFQLSVQLLPPQEYWSVCRP